MVAGKLRGRRRSLVKRPRRRRVSRAGEITMLNGFAGSEGVDDRRRRRRFSVDFSAAVQLDELNGRSLARTKTNGGHQEAMI
jgi:hypothetical protein